MLCLLLVMYYLSENIPFGGARHPSDISPGVSSKKARKTFYFPAALKHKQSRLERPSLAQTAKAIASVRARWTKDKIA